MSLEDTYNSEACIAEMRAEYYVRIAQLWAKVNSAPSVARRAALFVEIDQTVERLKFFEEDRTGSDRWLAGPA
jgi:hypothetical protein